MDASALSYEDLLWLHRLREALDERLERSLLEQHSVEECVLALLPLLCEQLGADGAFVHTLIEDRSLRTLEHGVVEPAALGWARAAHRGRERFAHADGAASLVQGLDVAGTWFGAMGVRVRAGVGEHRAAAGLDAACELLDNQLYAVAAAQRKHATMLRLGEALRDPLLDDGLKRAVDVLHEQLPLERMLLAFQPTAREGGAWHVQVYEAGERRVDSLRDESPQLREQVASAFACNPHAAGAQIATELGLAGHGSTPVEEVLISGVTEHNIIGTLLAVPQRRQFNTYHRDLLTGFAGFVRQRLVDFNKEWRGLASTFNERDVARLLRTPDYHARYLAPREAQVAVLFADIAGFTRLCEQVLRTPSKVARLVEVWSQRAVDILWAHGGAFDKMVGDCVIALFGPPFFDKSPGEQLDAALRAALALREMTEKMPDEPEFSELRAHGGLQVAIGVNLANVCVGTFGPDAEYTGFSSGMNNTARLQGCASAGEVLVMAEALATLPDAARFVFGEPREAPVKNVAQPLRFVEVREAP